MEQEEKVMLVFPGQQALTFDSKGLPNPVQNAAIALEEISNWFKSFKVDSIELSIEGSIKSGPLTNLIVSAEGKGGMKITLKPKTT